MKEKGTILLMTIFITFVLTTLGLGLLMLSQIHSKISAYSKLNLGIQYASECGIKHGMEKLLYSLNSSSFHSNLQEEKIYSLRNDIKKGGKEIIEYLLGFSLPFRENSILGKYSCEEELSFSLAGFQDNEYFTEAEYCFMLKSVGRMQSLDSSSVSILKGSLGLLAGRIPLSFFPVLLEEKPESGIIENQKIKVITPREDLLGEKVYISGNTLIPDFADSQLLKALNIKYFYPYKLKYADLRKAIGLEPVNEPIPPGVYLIKNDMGLGGIYIEGDVEKMVLAIEESFQVIGFFTSQGAWILKFSPELSKTTFKTPYDFQFYNLVPLGIIITNGKIHSLGGGIVNSEGIPVLSDIEVPSIIKGLNLSIISSDKIEISSHLILQGVKWEKGIPYIKEKIESQLFLFSTGKDFFDGSEKEGGIIINENSPDELKLHASLISSSSRIKAEGENKEIQIFGSIQASKLYLGSNEMEIFYDSRLKEEEFFHENYPLTSSSVLLVSDLNILCWKELQ